MLTSELAQGRQAHDTLTEVTQVSRIMFCGEKTDPLQPLNETCHHPTLNQVKY